MIKRLVGEIVGGCAGFPLLLFVFVMIVAGRAKRNDARHRQQD